MLKLPKNGFTLVEMLVVISILSLVGVLILTIFTRTLKGSNKSQIIGVIKQNGQSVLENMDKTVRSADNVVCVSTPSSKSLVVVKSGIYTRYRFITSSGVNGLIQQDSPVKQIDPDTQKEETDPQFVNRVCADSDPLLSVPVILTDTNPKSGVSLENGLFSRDKSAGFRDTVRIKFDLKPGVSAPSVVAGQIDPVTFQTTIQLR